MQRYLKWIIILFWIIQGTNVLSQQKVMPGYKTKSFKAAPVIELDSLTLIPASVTLWYRNGDSLPCLYEIVDNKLFFKDSACVEGDSVILAKYRTLPFFLGRKFRYIDSSGLTEAGKNDNYIYDYKLDPGGDGAIFGTKGVDYSGSFSRGISIGNNQDLVYDADFNMAMEGDIGDGIHIKGAISDNKLPVQPEGTSKQLSAFDRVFIEISKAPYSLLAGDYNSRSGHSRFLKYDRKLLGLSFRSSSEDRKGWKEESKLEFAISKGKYRKQQLQVKEGNQGPYKLTGKQGERFIVVISGSERVYYDGILLQRGEDADYVMNYNLGEIAFTIRRPVTMNSRIIIEFEYLNQQYSRSVWTGSTTWASSKARLFIEAYSRTDSRKPSVNFQGSFDSAAIAMLSLAPEQAGDIFLSSIRPIEQTGTDTRISYVLRDTVYTVMGMPRDTQVLVFAPGTTGEQKYTASFSEVDEGKGDYRILKTDANGRVYYWVAPDPVTGEKQGNFVPAIRIVPPSSQHVIDFGGKYDLNEHLSASAEASFSNLDLNRYSTLYEDNDNGVAASTGLHWKHTLYDKWTLEMQGEYRFRSRTYAVVDPYRDIEFNRYWNLKAARDSSYDEHLPELDIRLFRSPEQTISYRINSLYRPGNYTGQRHSWGMKWYTKRWSFDSRGGIMNAVQSTEKSRFYTPSAHLSYKRKSWEMGIRYQGEDNRRIQRDADTLNATSFYFHQLEAYLQKKNPSNTPSQLRYIRRIDGLPYHNKMQISSVSEQYSLRHFGRLGKANHWNIEAGLRHLDVREQLISNTTDNTTVLGKLGIRTRLWHDALRYNATYELNSGQEPKLEYVFVEVKPGEGQYIFKDFNKDGIPQINEYILAPYSDTARYVKLRSFNNHFIHTNSTILQQAVSFNPAIHSNGKKRKAANPWLNWTLRSVYRSDKKSKSALWLDRFNPFESALPDSLLVRLSYVWDNRWVYNPAGSYYDLIVGYKLNKQRLILVTGYEQSRLSVWSGKLRWNILPLLDVRTEVKSGFRQADSESFDDRDYDIRFDEGELQLNYLPDKKMKLSLINAAVYKKNRGLLEAFARQISVGTEAVYRQSIRQSVRASFKYASVLYTGEPGTALEIVMLDGLKNGNNFLWMLQWDRKLSANVYLKINYNGRKTGTSKVFHTGTMQVRAVF